MQLRVLLGLVLTASVGCAQQHDDPGDSGSDPQSTASLPEDALDTGATTGVSVTVSGPGRVTSVPPGIDCVAGGAGCRAQFSPDLVKVTLVVDHASTVRWSGACAGNGDCRLDPLGAAVSAETFAPQHSRSSRPAAMARPRASRSAPTAASSRPAGPVTNSRR